MEKSNRRLGYLYGTGEELHQTHQQKVIKMIAVQYPCKENNPALDNDYIRQLRQIFEGKESSI